MKLIPAIILLALLIATSASADRAFLLGERYRIGKYLPARSDAAVSVTGAIPAHIRPPSESAYPIVPLFVLRSLERAGTTSRALADDERLIGATTPGPEIAAELFSGLKTEFVTLSLADPLPGPAVAWGTLDAVLLDVPAAARVTESQVATLLASGTTVAIRSDRRPGGAWAWQRHGAWWVTRPDAPPVDLVQPDRYASVAAASAPAGFRRVLLFTLVAFGLAVLAASLRRSRWTWIVVVLLAVLATPGLFIWRANQPTSVPTSTEEQSGLWLDRWTVHTAYADGPFRQPIALSDAAAWPVFYSRRHAQDIDLRLECAADGTPLAFAGSLKRGQSLAFVTRSIAAAH